MSPDRRMDSAQESDSDHRSRVTPTQHLGKPERLLCLGAAELWTTPSTEEQSLEHQDHLPSEGTWDAILRTVHPSSLPTPLELSEEISRSRARLSDSGRLLLLFEGVHTPPAPWVRGSSEGGFLVIYSGPTQTDDGEGVHALLALQRDDHRIRPYRSGDEMAILELFKRSFHKTRSLERWIWEYQKNPWANEKISLAEGPEGGLTTHYAGYGMPFWYHGRTFIALQIGDTMTDPEARSVGRGTRSLLARTVRHFFACHRGGGVGFYYGFNTGPIQRFCRWFIGGMEVEPVNYRWRGPDPPEPNSGYRVTRITKVGRAFDRFFHRVAPRYVYLVQRDARYLQWRYLTCPDVDYRLFAVHRWGRLVGWGAFKRGETNLVWGDALFAPEHRQAAGNLLAAAWQSFDESRPAGIEAWFPNRPVWWHEQLGQLGFEERDNPSKLGFMLLPDEEQEAPLSDLYYSMGDGDLF